MKSSVLPTLIISPETNRQLLIFVFEFNFYQKNNDLYIQYGITDHLKKNEVIIITIRVTFQRENKYFFIKKSHPGNSRIFIFKF